MNLCFRYLVLLCLAFSFWSCSNELDVLADYEETASVYALLDPNQSYQFVKINKVFINPNARASDVAKVSDSLYFDTLSPYLIEKGSNKRIPLIRANIALKDSGYFANSPNYLYVTNTQLFANESYKIEFELPNSKKVVSAETNMVVTPFLAQPVSFSQNVVNISTSNSMAIQFQSSKNSKIFDAYFYFNYVEINKIDSSIRENKTITWKILKSYKSLSDKGNEFIIQRIPGTIFFDLLLNNIPVNPNVFRKFADCEVTLISGNVELDTYIQSSTPSIGIVQKQTEYTNIKNGIGIFASRNTLSINPVKLSPLMRNFIINDSDLKLLNFTN